MSVVRIEVQGAAHWSRALRRAFARVERQAARSLQANEAVEKSLMPLRKAIADDDGSQGSLVPVRVLVGLFDAAKAQADKRHHDCVADAVPFVTRRWLEQDHYRAPKPDPVMSNALRMLGREYGRFGEWDTAAEMYLCATLTADRRTRRLGAHLSAVIYVFLAGDTERIELLRDLVTSGSDPNAKRLLQILAMADTDDRAIVRSSFSSLKSALEDWALGDVPGVGHLVEYVLKRGNAVHLHDEVAEFASSILVSFGSKLPLSETAGVHQELALACMVTGETIKAQAAANVAISYRREILKGRIDDGLRETVRARYERSAAVRLESALSRQMLGEVQTYLLEDHLAANVAAYLEVDPHEPIAEDVEYRSDAVEEATKGDGWFPSAISRCWEDVLHSTTDLQEAFPSHAQTVALPNFMWLLTRYYDCIYWLVSERGRPVSAGRIDLNDDNELAAVLRKFQLEYGPEKMRSDHGDEWLGIDLWTDLAEWGSFNEVLMTGALGRLVPILVRERLIRGEVPLLTIGPGSGIPPIPWPVIRLSSSRSEADKRLIESTDLAFWLSAQVALAKGQPPPTPQAMSSPSLSGDNNAAAFPLLAAIDALDENGNDLSLYLRARAVIHVAYCGDRPADANRQAMGDLHLAEPRGVFFYRGHMHTVVDNPVHAFLLIPGLPSEGVGELLHAGQLFGRYDSGRPWFPMPHRVVLSCCASASAGLAGHEALSFVAGSIVGAGAREVIATATEVASTAFTAAFDDFLAEVVQEPVPIASSLATLQRRMLTEWKVYSTRGGVSDDEAALKAPHPLVWAMYRAY